MYYLMLQHYTYLHVRLNKVSFENNSVLKSQSKMQILLHKFIVHIMFIFFSYSLFLASVVCINTVHVCYRKRSQIKLIRPK
jgi:hypothetical protein